MRTECPKPHPRGAVIVKLKLYKMTQVKLGVTGVRYFETRRGYGYEATTNVKNVVIWNDGHGGGTFISPHSPYTTPYIDMKESELEKLINHYEMSKEHQHSDSDVCEILFRDFPKEAEMILEYLDQQESCE